MEVKNSSASAYDVPAADIPIKHEELDDVLKEIASQEQLYSIALFDILGFSNFVEENGTQVILDLYNKLLDLIYRQQSTNEGESSITGVVPVPISDDWKNNQYIAQGNGYVNVIHFSDTFIIYVNYQLNAPGYWLRDMKYEKYPLLIGEIGTEYSPLFFQKHNIYISFLQTCMDFFCSAIASGIPLRGCITTGMATMDKYKNIYIGKPLVEAAKGETAQNSLGMAFGKSFNNYHPVYNDYFIPYLKHIKPNPERSKFLSPMVPDWVRYWRQSSDYNHLDLKECISKMNKNANFSSYYDNALDLVDFSNNHPDWFDEIDREGILGILDYYEKTKAWYENSVINND